MFGIAEVNGASHQFLPLTLYPFPFSPFPSTPFPLFSFSPFLSWRLVVRRRPAVALVNWSNHTEAGGPEHKTGKRKFSS